MSLVAGLTSITHRQLDPPAIVDLARSAGLRAVEWGADVHVPPGDIPVAREVARICRQAGLLTPSYGTYFRLGEDDPASFGAIVASAEALGATQIRVWAGRRSSRDIDDTTRRRVVESGRAIADLAAAAGMTVGIEFHENTVNDTAAASTRLVADIAQRNVASYWQPPIGMPDAEAIAQLARMLETVTTVHVFSWDHDGNSLPLQDRPALWTRVFALLERGGGEHAVLLEHVEQDDPKATVRDARTLLDWCAAATIKD